VGSGGDLPQLRRLLQRERGDRVDRLAGDEDVPRRGAKPRAVALRADLRIEVLRELFLDDGGVRIAVAALEVRHDALERVLAMIAVAALAFVAEADARAARSHLVHVVRDDRLVLVLDADREPRLDLREHEPVAVVVVADVLVVQVGVGAVERRPLRLVPVIDDEVLAVGVLRGHDEQDDVIENLLDVESASRHHLDFSRDSR